MDYYYSNIRNRKVLRILFKTSIFSILTCFLALFAGSVNGNKVATVKDDKGFEGQVVLTSDYDKNVQILKNDKNIKLQANDVVSFAENGQEYTCYIKRSIPIELEVDHIASQKEAKPGVSVAQFLEESGLNLQAEDELLIEKQGVEAKLEKDGGLNRSMEVENGLKITVKKANFSTRIVENEIDYRTEEKFDATLEEGKQRIEVKGEKGLAQTELQEKMIDGKIVEIKQIGESKLVREPKTEVVVRGTKKPDRSTRREAGVVPANGEKKGKVSKKPTITPTITANQTNKPGKTGTISGFATSYKVGNVTSLGARPNSSTIAGDPSVIPYGSTVVVRNKKTGKVIRTGVMGDHCPTAVKKKRGVVVDLYGANIGRVPVTVEWSKK